MTEQEKDELLRKFDAELLSYGMSSEESKKVANLVLAFSESIITNTVKTFLICAIIGTITISNLAGSIIAGIFAGIFAGIVGSIISVKLTFRKIKKSSQ